MTHTKDTQALKLALEALETLVNGSGFAPTENIEKARKAITAIEQALAAPTVQGPVPLTARELELIDGMIEVQLDHAKRCDSIANRTMAERQKGWDMERVALLKKLKAKNT